MEEGVCVAMGVRSSTREGVGEAENRVLRNSGSIGSKGGDGGRGDKRAAGGMGLSSLRNGLRSSLEEEYAEGTGGSGGTIVTDGVS